MRDGGVKLDLGDLVIAVHFEIASAAVAPEVRLLAVKQGDVLSGQVLAHNIVKVNRVELTLSVTAIKRSVEPQS